MITLENIPTALTARPNWVLWRNDLRGGKPTKLPYDAHDRLARADDPTSWETYADAVARYERGGYEGIGYEFSDDDGLCGIDLDGCRDPESGTVSAWAKEIILTLDTYAEVSPSQTGVKLWVVGKSPFASGKKIKLPHEQPIGDKAAAIEVYDHGRYFAVTGWRLRGPAEPQPRQDKLDWLKRKYFPDAPTAPLPDFRSESAIADRARRYLAKLPPAVSGQDGHNRTFHAACVLVLGFGLDKATAMGVLQEWNTACQPPWSLSELEHKIDEAAKQPGERNYLRTTAPERWQSVNVPTYKAPPPPPSVPTMTTIVDAARKAINKMRAGEDNVIPTCLADLDDAIGGGVEMGEYVILAALPSHGKTAFALQIAHNWTAAGKSVLIASEEMSDVLLGKRTLQFWSDMPNHEWHANTAGLEADLEAYAAGHAPCYIVQNCGTAAAVADRIDAAVRDHGIQAAFVDYVQLLESPGGSRYEKVTNSSLVLNAVRKRNKIVLFVLAQLKRELETRSPFMPYNSDIGESGQMGRDADVILHLVWPWKIDNKKPPHEYLVFVGKNRNREVKKQTVTCQFNSQRQMVMDAAPPANYEPKFDRWNAGEPVTEGEWP
jgi:KaiC/GvpD/RAD55 family RecA-like ATPase